MHLPNELTQATTGRTLLFFRQVFVACVRHRYDSAFTGYRYPRWGIRVAETRSHFCLIMFDDRITMLAAKFHNQHTYSEVTRPLIGSTKCKRCEGLPTAAINVRAYSLCDSGEPVTNTRPPFAIVSAVGVWKCPI